MGKKDKEEKKDKQDNLASEKEAAGQEQQSESAKKKQPVPVPLLLDASITATQIVVLVVGVSTLVLSLLAGALMWVAALRGAAALLAVGLILWLANWHLARHTMEAAYAKLQQKAEKEPVESTIERSA